MTSISGVLRSKKVWVAAPLLAMAGGYAASCSQQGRTEEATQTEFTAGVVMTKMEPNDRYPFVAGIVEGLAYARYVKDGETTAGRGCIYRWFYDDKSTVDKIYEGFRRYPDALPGEVVGILATTKCGA